MPPYSLAAVQGPRSLVLECDFCRVHESPVPTPINTSHIQVLDSKGPGLQPPKGLSANLPRREVSHLNNN